MKEVPGIFFSGVLMILLLPAAARAGQVLEVDRSGMISGSFLEIQDALDQAGDGDLILVHPTGGYDGFTVDNLGVVIRASRNQFYVNQEVSILNLEPGKKASISGMTLTPGPSANGNLVLRDSPGEIILERILVRWDPFGGLPPLHVKDCGNLSVSDFRTEGESFWGGSGPAITLHDSSARLTGIDIQGGTGDYEDTSPMRPGHDGLEAVNSYVELSRCRIIGGRGAAKDCYPCGPDQWCSDRYPGRGANGALFRNSTVVITGDFNHFFRPGAGGVGDYPLFCRGTDGPPGLFAVDAENSHIEVSGVSFDGAIRNTGSTITRNDNRPFLFMTSDLYPGKPVETFVRNFDLPAFVFLIWSNQGGSQSLGPWTGHHLSAVPGDFFEVFGAGTDTQGLLQVDYVTSTDPFFLGFPLITQAGVISDSGNFYLTNSVARIIGP